MAAQSVVYKSVTLQPGEQFTLPPGGELVSADSIDDLESTCELPEMEDLTCYEIVIMGSREDSGTPSHPYEQDDFTLTSMTVGGITYDIPDSAVNFYGVFYMTDIKTYIAANIPLLTDVDSNAGTDTSNSRGGTTSLCFKTIPSLIANTYITGTVNYPSNDEDVENSGTTIRFYAQPRGTYTGVGACEECES